jgi:hypothetical protein
MGQIRMYRGGARSAGRRVQRTAAIEPASWSPVEVLSSIDVHAPSGDPATGRIRGEIAAPVGRH